MPIPGRSLFVLLWVALGLAVPVSIVPQWLPAWGGLLGMALGLALLDALRLALLPPPEVRRQVSGSLALGRWHKVGLYLSHRGRRAQRLEVFDHFPSAFESERMPVSLALAVGYRAEIDYRVRPSERGEHRFPRVQLRIHSPWRFWLRNQLLVVEDLVRVYPNFALVAKYTLLATDNRLSQMGVKRQLRRGQGLEFHQLREYRQGDSLRQIDWKTTARLRKAIAKEYQEERDQQILLLVDTSRRMLAKDGELSHFDLTLNACLLLTYVALRQGDAVGLATFGGEQRWLMPAKGGDQLNRILNTLYDLQPDVRVPDYRGAASRVLTAQHKRALVILLTNLRDEDTDDLAPAVRVMGRHHLVLVVNLTEQILKQALAKPIKGFEDALRSAAIHVYERDQRATLERLAAQGVERLDVAPADLSVALVNRYLSIKAGGRL